MTNINVEAGQYCEVVDETTFHLETEKGILLISIEIYTINYRVFLTSYEAVNYIHNL